MQEISIIIAEDDAIICWDLQRVLDQLNHTQVQVVDKSDWVDKKPMGLSVDLVITNLKLADGWVTEEYLDKIVRTGSAILVLTGMGDLGLQPLAMRPQHLSFLFKPYTSFQIHRRIRELLPALRPL